MRIVQHGSSFFGFHIVQPHSSTYIVHPHKKRIPLKPVNSFIFVCFRWCKNSTPALSLAYKSTYTHHDSSVKNTDIIRGVLANACANSYNRRPFLLFQAFGLIHINTR